MTTNARRLSRRALLAALCLINLAPTPSAAARRSADNSLHSRAAPQGEVGAVGVVTGRVLETYCGRVRRDGCQSCVRGAAGVTVQLGDLLATQTAADGSYTFDEVPAGEYTVSLFVNGFGEAKSAVSVEPGETSSLDLNLPFAEPGVMLVTFSNDTGQEQIDAFSLAHGVTVLRTVSAINLYVLQIAAGSYTDEVMSAYSQNPLVLYAERDFSRCAWAWSPALPQRLKRFDVFSHI